MEEVGQRASVGVDNLAKQVKNLEEMLKKQSDRINQHRHERNLAPGEVVFRKMPPKARPPKASVW